MTKSDESRISINLLLLTLQLILHLCMLISQKKKKTHAHPKIEVIIGGMSLMATTQFSWSNVILSIKIDVIFIALKILNENFH